MMRLILEKKSEDYLLEKHLLFYTVQMVKTGLTSKAQQLQYVRKKVLISTMYREMAVRKMLNEHLLILLIAAYRCPK